MNAHRIVALSLIASAVAIWLFNGYIFATLFTAGSPKKHLGSVDSIQTLASIAGLADSALKSRPTVSQPAFKGQFENPFRTAFEAFAAPQKKASGAPETQVKLVLRGVLLKKQPLAILEDEAGKTYICGKDETVKGQRIERIEATSVTLRNTLGSYTLTVKE